MHYISTVSQVLHPSSPGPHLLPVLRNTHQCPLPAPALFCRRVPLLAAALACLEQGPPGEQGSTAGRIWIVQPCLLHRHQALAPVVPYISKPTLACFLLMEIFRRRILQHSRSVHLSGVSLSRDLCTISEARLPEACRQCKNCSHP